MSNIFVTESGFVKKTLAELKTEYELLFQGAFGSSIDLDPEGPFGQLIGILSKRDADLWDGAEEIYNSRNPDSAVGTSLDNIAAETGVTRNDATPTEVDDVLLYGDEGTVVADGKQARQPNGTTVFALSGAVTISKTAARRVRISLDDPSAGGVVYTVTIDSIPYTYTSLLGDTEADVIADLISSITAGSWEGTASNISDMLDLLYVDADSNIDWSATFTLELLASGGRFVATTAGVSPLPADTLTEIVTPVSGWDSVNNPIAGITGSDVESDSDFRIRRSQVFLTGNATDEAIRTALLTEVAGVSSVQVISNRTMITDGESRPPKSFEAIVSGGADTAVAEKIWEVMPSGIEPYGNTTETIIDSQGVSQVINFSRPVSVNIWVRVSRSLDPEETYPDTGDLAIKEAIVAYALANIGVGKDVIRLRLSTPIYTVPGIKDITIELSLNGSVWVTTNLTILSRQLASFSTARITVQNL